MARWLDKYEQGGLVLKKKTKDNFDLKVNPNDVKASVGPGFVGDGYNTKGRNYSPAWGGQFAMGGALPGAVGFTYARVAGSAPANGKYTKKTKASAQNGKEMSFYQNGLDFKPKSISKNGSVIKDDMGQWAHPGEITEIGSNDITMQGVDYPVLGVSDTGDTKMMYPDQDYKFDGEKVTEFPMMEKGGWLDKYKAQTGITTNIEAGTINPTAQLTTLAKEAERKVKEKAKDKAIVADRNKRIAASVAAKKQPFSAQQLADVTQATGDKFRLFPNDPDSFIDEYINPGVFIGNLASGMGRVPLDIQQGNYGKAALNVAMPAMIGAGEVIAAPYLKQAGKYLTENTALKNAYKLNPYAFKADPTKYYRQAGKAAYDDAMIEGKMYAKGQKELLEKNPNINYTDEYNASIAADEAGKFHLTKPANAPFVQKGKLFYPIDRKPTGAGYKGTKFADAEYLFEGALPDEAVLPRYQEKYLSSLNQSGGAGVVRPEFNDLNNFKTYQRDWLQGYKEVPKPTSTQTVTRGPIPAPYKGTVLPYDNIGYKEPATGELAPYLTPEFESIPYSELPKSIYHGGPKVISDVEAIQVTREGLPIQSATTPTSRGFYATPNTWMHMEGSPNPFRDVEGFYPKLASENAENYAMGRGDAYIHAGEFVENPRIVDWKTFSQMEPVKALNPDFRRLSPEAAKIAEDLGIYGLRDQSEYNILNPQKVFKSFKPTYKNLGKGWEKYKTGGWLNKYK